VSGDLGNGCIYDYSAYMDIVVHTVDYGVESTDSIEAMGF
jgi:hypothetical protein